MSLWTNSQSLPTTQWDHVFRSRGDSMDMDVRYQNHAKKYSHRAQTNPSWHPRPRCSAGSDGILWGLSHRPPCLERWTWVNSCFTIIANQLSGFSSYSEKHSCGHEGVGLVAAVGSHVNGLRIGDTWINRTCGVCEFCSTGRQPLCPKLQLSGYMVDGTFQQYCICKADNAVRIPSGIPLEAAAPVLCAGITVYKALKESQVQPGQIIADYFVDYKLPDVAEEVKRVTGGGPHAAMIVSSVEEPFHQATQYIRPGGTIVAVGLPPGKICTDLFQMVTQRINIKGSYVGNRDETEEALAIIIKAGISVQYEVVDFSELPNIYDQMEKDTSTGEYATAVLTVSRNYERPSRAQNWRDTYKKPCL
ncbi:protein disulfide isomerase (PDI) protein [Aspergillus brasiliensis]|nr:protein disulfide isomerase (PDI) protein [Aspergillus brasiliensis]